jgi:oligopeptide transport system substrate-binding protein
MKWIALIFFISGCVGCQKPKTALFPSPKKHHTNRFLQLSFNTDVRSLDPRIGVDIPSVFAVKMLFEGLMRIGPDGDVQPALAERYEVSADHKTYTFFLRPSMWTNGEEVTAYDFEYSWKKMLEPRSNSLGIQNFYLIKNVKEIVRGERSINSVGFRALDEKTLQIELIHPAPYFLNILASSSFFSVNAKVDNENPQWANQAGEAFVCNGPFRLYKHQIENEIRVEKNPYYWDAGSVLLPGISIAIIKDSITQRSLFEKNQLDWYGRPLNSECLRNKHIIEHVPTIGVYWYFVNVDAFPFQNKKMRQAFAYAINRQEITDHVLEGGESPAMALLSGLIATQTTPFFKDNNRETAIQLFKEGLEELQINKEELPEITINYNSAPIHQKVAEAIQQQLKQVFQLNIKLEQHEWKAHYAKLQQGNYQLGGMGWISWLRDPIYFMQTFRDRSDGVNMSKWENARYQALLSAAEQEIDTKKRKLLFNKTEKLILEEMPVIPIYFTTIAYCKNPKLKNVYISELYEVDFRWAYLEK